MSIHGRARRDRAETPIRQALEALGCVVQPLSGAKGCPDLLCGVRGTTVLAEVKTGKAKRRPEQTDWANSWTGGPVVVLRTVHDVQQLVRDGPAGLDRPTGRGGA